MIVGEHAVWLRHGVIEVEAIRESAGASFLIVRPVGWTGDAAWIAVSGEAEQLRSLVGRDEAAAWLRELRAPTTARPRGDLVRRRQRYLRTVDFGTPHQQVSALAHAYAEAHRPDIDDVDVLDRLERLIVVEIAASLGRDWATLREELRAGRPRFAADAPRSGTIHEPPPPHPQVQPGCSWISTFEVGETLLLVDLAGATRELPAQPGTWHAFGVDGEEDLYVVDEGHLPLGPFAPPEARLVLARGDGDPFAIVAGPVDAVIDAEINDRFDVDLDGRGVAFFPREGGLEVRVLEARGSCVAIWVGPQHDDDE